MTETKELHIVTHLRETLAADQTRTQFRVKPTDFTRTRQLPLPRLTTLILRGHKVSQQNALNKVFAELEALERLPTGSAYCQARQKLDPTLFTHLNQQTVSDFYALSTEDESLYRWHGHRVLGADGTTLNLPDTPETRRRFSVLHNQHQEYVQATAVVLYDLGNDLGLAAWLGPLCGEKEPLLGPLWSSTQPGDVLVLDRNFADYEIIATALQRGRHVVIRCPRQFNAVKAFLDSAACDQRVELTAPDSPEIRERVRQHELPPSVQVRLLKFTLPSGEIEVVLTDLCDPQTYPHADFYPLYGRRWGQETYYDRFKNIFEVERWSGQSVLTIQQDFFGVLFLTTLESVLAQSAQTALTQRDQLRQPETKAQVNRAVSYVALVDHVVELLADPRTAPAETLAQLQQLLQMNPTRQRPGRQYARPRLKYSRRVRYLRYRKRLTA
jgi:hypothetical protein